jgi:hypothetical protein
MIRYNKETVIKAMENYKTRYGYKIVTKDNQLIAYAGENYKTLVFTETEDGKAYTQRACNDLPKKYRELFGIEEKTNEKGEIEYIAHCIEYGEKFIERFYAPKGLSKALLLEEGQKLAQEWGGECYKVTVA